jgi:hypothetical protein
MPAETQEDGTMSQRNRNFVEVTVSTTSGLFPASGTDRVPVNQTRPENFLRESAVFELNSGNRWLGGGAGAAMQDPLNTAAQRENARTLARILGVEVESATRLLDVSIAVTFDPDDAAAALLGQQTTDLLRRTVTEAGLTMHKHSAAAEVVIGSASPRTAGGGMAATPSGPLARQRLLRHVRGIEACDRRRDPIPVS